MAESKASKADRIAQLRAKLQQLEAQDAAAQRKADARRKIILGGAIIAEMSEDEILREKIADLLQKRVTKPKDLEAVNQWLSTALPPESSPGPKATAVQPLPPTGRANA